MHMEVPELLIRKCLKNDRRAHNELYKLLFGYLMSICMRYQKNYDDAGAAVNAIFLKIVLGLSDFDGGRPFLPWVKTIAIRHLIDEHRKTTARNERIVFDDEQIEDEGYTSLPSTEIEAKDLLIMVKSLPETTAKVFNLHVMDGYKHNEIGEMLNLSEGTSRWHLSIARKQLQALLIVESKKLDHNKTISA
ncbi:MAG: RNA polymerase sigma factor (sigma-70 family) [Bacteroidia bacterium]|jgi:RNA polymerase sigma factor (sigma-70 family)